MKAATYTLALFFLSLSKVFSQDIEKTLSTYADNFPQEKAYVQFDRSIYTKGETIWFKAYVLADLQLSPLSKTFYTDWFNENGDLIYHHTAPMYQSSAKGTFTIPKDYNGKILHVKAYTSPMLNYDTAFLFYKDILVNQSGIPENKAESKSERKADKKAEEKLEKKLNVEPLASLTFFPEGGDLVKSLESKVAFLVTNQFGKPVSAAGALKNNKGEIIDSIITIHDGMGSFNYTPETIGPASVNWMDEFGKTHTTTLPIPKESGVVLEVQPTKAKALYLLKRTADVPESYKTMNVMAIFNQHIVYKAKINFQSTKAFGEVPIKDLPTGVLQITVFDANWKPIVERVVFVNNDSYQFVPAVNIYHKGLGKREKTELEIEAPVDSFLTNMSIAVTDAELYSDETTNIYSQFLLSSDIKGYIHNPAYYFSGWQDSISQHLDLVMLTHGWRRYNWPDIAQGKLPVLHNPYDSDYLQIKGKVFGRAFERKKTDLIINLLLEAKDSSRNFFPLTVSRNGEFSKSGLLFFDTLKAYYQFNGEKRLTNVATVTMNAGLLEPHSNKMAIPENLNYEWATPKQKEQILKRAEFFTQEKERVDKMLKAQQLEEVTVSTKARRAVDELDEKYTTGLFSGGDSYQYDILNDPIAQSALDVFSYLQGRVAGLIITIENGDPVLSWRGSSPELFLDEQRTTTDILKTISMNDVAYIKVFRPPFFGSTGGGAGGAIGVYTRKGGDTKFQPGQGLGFVPLAGYSVYKEFYKPNYSTDPSGPTDVRETIYWNPFLLTDPKQRKVKVEFYNNDISKRLRLIVEGINSDGKMTRIEKILE